MRACVCFSGLLTQVSIETQLQHNKNQQNIFSAHTLVFFSLTKWQYDNNGVENIIGFITTEETRAIVFK